MSSNGNGLHGMIRPWKAFMKQQHSALARSTQAITRETRTQDLLAESSVGIERRVLWIDGIGGFQLLDRDEVLIGQAITSNVVDVSIVGDLSRQAAAIRRSQGDYLLQPLQPTQLDDHNIDRPQLLHDGSVMQFGSRVKVKFSKPNPLSATARLDLVSVHRFKPSVDAVLLLADSCVLGPNPGSHVVCPNWNHELLMFRHQGAWGFRTLEPVEVNGQEAQGQIKLESGMRMRGKDFSLTVE